MIVTDLDNFVFHAARCSGRVVQLALKELSVLDGNINYIKRTNISIRLFAFYCQMLLGICEQNCEGRP